jgi:biotin carboxyl carrier protein
VKLKITVHGVAYEVEVEVLDPGEGFPAGTSSTRTRTRGERGSSAGAPPPRPAEKTAPAPAGTEGGSVASPIAGTVVEIKVKTGDSVEKGQILLVIEAMKMKTSIAAPTAGKIKSIPVAVGDTVHESQILAEFE